MPRTVYLFPYVYDSNVTLSCLAIDICDLLMILVAETNRRKTTPKIRKVVWFKEQFVHFYAVKA
jgi:hypothetical protein